MQRFRKISAIALSMLVLFSSTSLMFSAHLCMGEIQDVALFSHASTCGMATPVSPCNSPESDNNGNITRQGCCEDLTMIVEGQEITKPETLSVQEINLIAAFAWSYRLSVNPASVDIDSYEDYTPPLIDCDIHVLVQSFLI